MLKIARSCCKKTSIVNFFVPLHKNSKSGVMHILFIKRAEKYSPNSVERDAAIMAAVQSELERMGHTTTLMRETDFVHRSIETLRSYPACFHMARSAQALALLEQMQLAGCQIWNCPKALQAITRRMLLQTASEHGIGVPAFSTDTPLTFPFWWKRDDHVSQSSNDVVLVHNEEQWKEVQSYGAQAYVMEAHLPGDLIKFYGVRETGFFYWNYPTFSKFGKESENGLSAGYPFDAARLQTDCQQLAALVGLSIYGGDAIVTADGKTYIIDFNDWPSFSSCRLQAAAAIAFLISKQPTK